MSESKDDLKKCKPKKFMILYTFLQLGSRVITAIALISIAIGFCSYKKESILFSDCVNEIIEEGNSSSYAVHYCNGGKR